MLLFLLSPKIIQYPISLSRKFDHFPISTLSRFYLPLAQMLFNSIPFLVFLPLVFCLYWFVFQRNLRVQNSFLILASYLFYGWWDWRFLSLIILSSAVDYWCGKNIEGDQIAGNKKRWLWLSLGVNLGVLGFFKYYNFFVDSFANLIGLDPASFTLNIILPVGISFYTFQTMSYTIDIYRGKIKASKDPFAFFAFVSFFPQLVAGPIERAKDLLPQFEIKRKFEYNQAADGLRQMLWGFFKKLVVADNCAPIVNEIFANYGESSTPTLWLGAILFAFQIYCDFSGYSDIAIGTARLFGIQLKQNFAFPYFSRDLAEFWRRWHISLSTWFRDYLYIPLGGSRGKTSKVIRNVFIIFLVSGIWHGANWTFVAWGGFHALLFIPLILSKANRKNLDSITPSRKNIVGNTLRILATFVLVTIAWVFFRAPSIAIALEYLKGMFIPQPFSGVPFQINIVLISCLILLATEWIHRKALHGLAIEKYPRFLRWSIYLGITIIIFQLGAMNNTSFIYFAF